MSSTAELWPDDEDFMREELAQEFALAGSVKQEPEEIFIDPEVPLPPYAAPLDEPHRYKVLWGGRGGAKSWTVARKLLQMAHRRPLRILCTREFQTSIKDSVHRLLRDQITALGFPYYVTEREIRHPNGSLFLFEGIRQNVASIKSMEGIDICWVEEGQRVSKDSWEVLIPTIRKEGSEIWVTFNPDLESDPTYQRMVVHPPPDAVVQKVGAEDNPWLPETLVKEREYLYRVDPDAAAHVWGGECRQATDAQILRGKWIVEEFSPDANTWGGPYQGCDFGFAQDPTTLVRCWIAGPNGRTLYIEHEAYQVGLELDDTASHFSAHVPNAALYVTRADSARPESISYLRRHGLPRMVAAPKWKGSVEDGIAHLRQYERIVIHPRCKHTAEEARYYSYKVDERTGDVLPVIVDAHNHTIDAIRYALAPLIKRGKVPRVFSPGGGTSAPATPAQPERAKVRRIG